jgi:glycosyltransferase involved in cell wall biosynthesis
VLTYHEGDNREYAGHVDIHRIRKPPLAGGVRPGFSLKKVLCDLVMRPRALRMAREGEYDVVHAVEEAVFMAMRIRRSAGIPYVFDMDSSMPQQMAGKLPLLAPLLPVMTSFERRAIRHALAVVPMCDALADHARKLGASKTVVLRDISLLTASPSVPHEDLRKALGIQGVCFLYLGNLETYQGIDLLLESFASPGSEARMRAS